MPEATVPACAIALCLVACVLDLSTRRVPNLFTFGASGAAIVYHLSTGGLPAAGLAAAGWAAGVVLFFPWYALGGMGAGDVKLVGAVGAWLGPSLALWTALYSLIAGGVLALVLAFAAGYLRTAIANVRHLLGYWRLSGIRPLPALTLTQASAPRLPFAVPILAGTLGALWLR